MSFIPVTNNSVAIAISKRRWIRRLNIFSTPDYGFVSWKSWTVFVYLKDWTGPSFHIMTDGVDSYENYNYDVLKKVCTPNSVFFDVGANVGIFSLRLAREKSDIKIYSFEPEPNANECLRKTIEANSIKSISLYGMALSNHTGSATFFFDAQNHGGHSLNSHSITESGNTVGNKFDVTLTTLDHFVEENKISNIDVIKLDVQLHEESVLQGSLKTISVLRPIFLIECYLNELTKNPSPLVQPFGAAGNYSIFDPTSKTFYTLDNYSDLIPRIHSNYRDLFFIPNERLNQFKNI